VCKLVGLGPDFSRRPKNKNFENQIFDNLATQRLTETTSRKLGPKKTRQISHTMGRLKGISPLLSPDLLHTLSSMGHGDELGNFFQHLRPRSFDCFGLKIGLKSARNKRDDTHL
jgi:hypothetical protein